MDIQNIALVRATNVIPFDGVVRPISNSPYLCKNISSEFSYIINDLLNESGIIPPLDYTKMDDEDYYDQMVALSSKILKEYLPYVSDYNSCVLFSLNGICPDDNEHGFGNNIFSTKKCGIIEPLSYHIDDVISLVPTDTAIQDDVVLSDEAIVLIAKDYYESLTDEQKIILNEQSFKTEIFEGSLKEAISNTLKKSEKYSSETLSLSREHWGYLPSMTSEDLKKTINGIALSYEKPQVRYFDILTGRNDAINQLQSMAQELNNSMKVQDYYLVNFLEFFFEQTNAPELMRQQLPTSIHRSSYMKSMKEFVKAYGMDNYKKVVDYYNSNLEREQVTGVLPTPQDIVSRTSQDMETIRR